MGSETRAKYYTLNGRTPVPAQNVLEWAEKFEEGKERHVAKTELPNGVHVSTVFLGLDHSWGSGPPMLFETMIFEGPEDGYQERYSTWEEAEAGHAKAVAIARGEKKRD